MPSWNHSLVQTQILQLINLNFPLFRAGAEVTVRLSTTRYLVPDVAVQESSRIQRPYPVEPVHLCVEVMSPEDRMSEVVAKCEEYRAWGVPYVWILNPEEGHAWEFPRGQRLHDVPDGGVLTAGPITIAVADVFALIQ